MQGKKHIHFEALKTRIVSVMKESYPGINPSIAEWRGQEITDFQEDLRVRVNGQISEKWFYTHMKSSLQSLPRIDMLNILSRYAGYANWDDFVFKNSETLIAENADGTAASAARPPQKGAENPNRFFYLVPLLAVVIVLVFYGLFRLFNTREYRFTFYDDDTREPIADTRIEVTLLAEGESPVQQLVLPDGSFRVKTDKSKIRMVVSAPYYRPDTITRMVHKLDRDEKVMLHADDYALMIHYFSMMKVDDWEKRRQKLEAIIDDGAMICQVFDGKDATGMALYNKQEFIDKMTMPAGNLKNVEILSSQMQDNRIKVLRFRINDKKR